MEVDPTVHAAPKESTSTQDEREDRSDMNLRDRILSHLSDCHDVHFKSQQIGDPELSSDEKKGILESVLNRSHGTFLSRFGHRLLPEHLEYFNQPTKNESYEVAFYLNKLKRSKCKPVSDVQVKNRRFEAMKRLISEGEYFSVGEMRKRNPLLFDQLLGGFLKNPESKLDDIQEHHVAHLLLAQIEQDQIAELKQSQLEAEMMQAKEGPVSDDDNDEDFYGGPTSTTVEDDAKKDDVVLWGKAYKNTHVIGKTRWTDKHGGSQQFKKMKKTHLSQQEKVLLISEFTSSMFNSFLDGKDEFDYSEVDNNPDYDDVNQRELDEQEKYFDSESPEDVRDIEQQNAEDDELDRFMKVIDDQITSENLADSFQKMNSSKPT